MVGVRGGVCRKLLISYTRERANLRHLVRRQSDHGRGQELQGGVHPASLERGGALLQSSHKLVRGEGCKGRSGPVPTWGYSTTPPRQQDSLCLYKKTGGDKESSSIKGGLLAVGRVLGKRRDPPGPPLAFHQGQCGSRFLVSERDGQMGVHFGQEPVHHDPGHVPGVSHLGCLCLQGDSSAAKVHDLVPGPSGCGFGCPSSQMGQGHLSLSSSSSVAESVAEGSNTENQSDFDLASVANSSVVASGGRDARGATPSSSSLQRGCAEVGSNSGSSLPRASGRSSHFKHVYSLTNASHGLDKDDLDFLSNHLAEGTKTGYGDIFNRFSGFCHEIGQDPFTCKPAVIVKYIRSLYEWGAAYSTVNHHRSCISKFHAGFDHIPAGSHPLVAQAVKSVFRLRPPLPKYVNTFDISIVFTFLQSLPANEDLDLKLLSYKTLFLLTSSTISRLSSLSRLGPVLRIFKVRFVMFSFTIFNLIIYRIMLFYLSLLWRNKPGQVISVATCRFTGFLRTLHYVLWQL